VFPNKKGNTDGHFLRKLKAIASKAGVEGAELHRFRKSARTIIIVLAKSIFSV